MKALFVTVIGIVLSFAASVANVYWLAAVAMVIALAGAYAQYRDTAPFELIFEPADWQKVAADFRLVVPSLRHKKASPTATVYLGQPPTFEEAMCDVSTDAGGSIVLGASQPFNGKVVIK